jgi:hypothetical protein
LGGGAAIGQAAAFVNPVVPLTHTFETDMGIDLPVFLGREIPFVSPEESIGCFCAPRDHRTHT